MELKEEDLITKCKKCGGTGHFKEIDGNWTREGSCPECGGTGGFLTEAGEAVAAVVRFVKRLG